MLIRPTCSAYISWRERESVMAWVRKAVSRLIIRTCIAVAPITFARVARRARRTYRFADWPAKTLAAARCVASTHGAGHAPMPTTPRMQMRIARPSSAGTWIRSVRTGASMYMPRDEQVVIERDDGQHRAEEHE